MVAGVSGNAVLLFGMVCGAWVGDGVLDSVLPGDGLLVGDLAGDGLLAGVLTGDVDDDDDGAAVVEAWLGGTLELFKEMLELPLLWYPSVARIM